MLQESNINLSIIVPVYNEELYLPNLFKDIKIYFNEKNIEIILIEKVIEKVIKYLSRF